jgi:hypothetical protein
MSDDTRRRLLWTSFCEQSAVLPWIRKVQRLALAAEDDTEYRHALAVYERVTRLQRCTAARRWQIDPAWCDGMVRLERFRPVGDPP